MFIKIQINSIGGRNNMKKIFGLIVTLMMVLMLVSPTVACGDWDWGYGSSSAYTSGGGLNLTMGVSMVGVGENTLAVSGGVTLGGYIYDAEAYSNGMGWTEALSLGGGNSYGLSLSRSTYLVTPELTRITSTNVTYGHTGSVSVSSSSSGNYNGYGDIR